MKDITIVRAKLQDLFPGKLMESIGGGEYTFEYTEWLENIIIRICEKESELNDKITKIIGEMR